MEKGTRVTLTPSQAKSAAGGTLIDLILTMCHDGTLTFEEVENLHRFLRLQSADLPAIRYLRAKTRVIVADGEVSESEEYQLKLAFERVVPKEARGIVSTHLESLGKPSAFYLDDQPPAWARHPATERQIAFIRSLGRSAPPSLTKGDASRLITQLLDRTPATARQVMVLRFFDRLDLITKTKIEIGEWIEDWLSADERHERAWENYTPLINMDHFEHDPTIVPVGAFRTYTRLFGQ
jgi:hypothetical protein